MSAGFIVLIVAAGLSAMGAGMVWLVWRSLIPTEAQTVVEADRRAAADREAAFRRGVAAERAAVVRLLKDVRAGVTDAGQKDGLGRIVDAIQIGGHVASRRNR